MSVCDKELEYLLEKIYRERGFDFREYREATVVRRVGRRMRARGAGSYADYARILDANPGEYEKLFNDLTINVTSFFRDEAAFKALEEMALPELTGTGTKNIHIWSAGCATGEELYSIAMLLMEIPGPQISAGAVNILGTDIDAKALQRAREAVFGPKEVEGIRPAWLHRYFVPESSGFRLQETIRQLVTFKIHNLVSDPPPYPDLDLVVCRNVLIYFTPALQTRVLKSFHAGLKDGGFLLLGKAEEPVGETKGLFYCVDKKAKLYRKTQK